MDENWSLSGGGIVGGDFQRFLRNVFTFAPQKLYQF